MVIKPFYIIYRRIILALVLAIISSNSVASCILVNKTTGKEFRIFNALLYENLPGMRELCIEDINVMYTWNFVPRRFKNGDMAMPLEKDLKKAIRKIREIGLVTVIDIEHWPLKGIKNEVAEHAVNNYYSVIKAIKREVPEIMVGYYGVIPVRDFSRARMPESNHRHKEWMEDNSRLERVGELVDATFPSLYTINPNHESWAKRGIAQISEARRIAKHKPVYPFIWPNYHEQGGRYPRGTEVEKDYWKMQLELLRDHADGIVVWGGSKQIFNQNMVWWKETVKFINENYHIKNIQN